MAITLTARDSSPVRQRRAADPATPPASLSMLACDENLHVRRAAAANPSTPPATLDLLRRAGSTDDLAGRRATAEPMPPEALDTLVHLGEWGRRLASLHPDASPRTLDALSGDPVTPVRLATAKHPSIEPAALARLACDMEPSVRMAAAGHVRMPLDTLAILHAAGAADDLSGVVAQRPGAAVDFVALIAAGPWGRVLAVGHPATPAKLIDELLDDPDWGVRAAVAVNPSATGEQLRALADLDAFEVRLALANHPHCPGDLLESLANDPHVGIRLPVASHPEASPALLRRLALDGSHQVRQHVAAHPQFAQSDRQQLITAGSTPDLQGFGVPDATLAAEVLATLADAGPWGQRLAVRHPATPAATLAKLGTSADPTLREAAVHHPRFPSDVLQWLKVAGSSEDLQGYGQADAVLPDDISQGLLALGPWARRLLARHTGTGPSVLDKLAHEEDAQVRRAVARHANTPHQALSALAQDVAHDVRWAVANRDDLDAPLLSALATDVLATIRVVAAEHPRTPAEAIERLRLDLDEDVRSAARQRYKHFSQPDDHRVAEA